jgi:hypothetical protein
MNLLSMEWEGDNYILYSYMHCSIYFGETNRKADRQTHWAVIPIVCASECMQCFSGKPEKISLGTPKHGWVGNIKMDFRQIRMGERV